MRPLRGRVACYDRIILYYLLFGIILTAGLGFILGKFVHYFLSIVLAFSYFIVLGIFVGYIKKRNKRLIRDSHFCLAAVLRAENNRYYLRKGMKLRPGHMSKWIEFHFVTLRR